MKNLEPEDLKLRTLLRDCRSAPALPPGFQNSVWQRLEKADANAPVSWLDAIANWLLVPRLALATVTAAVMLGAIVGSVHSSSNALEIERARYVASVSPSPLQ